VFWNKKKEPVEIVVVPKEHVRLLLTLWDACSAKPRGQHRVAEYELWSEVQRLFPQTQGHRASLSLPSSLRLELEIREADDKI